MASDHPKPARDADLHHAAKPDGSESQGRRGQVARAIAFFDSATKVLVALGGLIVAAAALWAAIAHFTSAGAQSAMAYSPAAYATQIDDHFTTDDLSSYGLVRSVITTWARFGEVAPAWSVGGGQASATAAQPWFGILISSAAPTTPQATAVVDVKTLDSGATNHNSGVFVGLVKDSSDYIMVWYNSYRHWSGEDLVLNGVPQPLGFQVACCADVILQPGDRFAFALDGNTVTSYYQANGNGPWTELELTSVAPLLDLTNPATLTEYHFTFGLAGDRGAMAVSRFSPAAHERRLTRGPAASPQCRSQPLRFRSSGLPASRSPATPLRTAYVQLWKSVTWVLGLSVIPCQGSCGRIARGCGEAASISSGRRPPTAGCSRDRRRIAPFKPQTAPPAGLGQRARFLGRVPAYAGFRSGFGCWDSGTCAAGSVGRRGPHQPTPRDTSPGRSTPGWKAPPCRHGRTEMAGHGRRRSPRFLPLREQLPSAA